MRGLVPAAVNLTAMKEHPVARSAVAVEYGEPSTRTAVNNTRLIIVAKAATYNSYFHVPTSYDETHGEKNENTRSRTRNVASLQS